MMLDVLLVLTVRTLNVDNVVSIRRVLVDKLSKFVGSRSGQLWLESSQRRSEDDFNHQYLWVCDLLGVVEKTLRYGANNISIGDFKLFWTHLYGVLDDLTEKFIFMCGGLRDLGFIAPTNQYMSYLFSVEKCCNKVKSLFKEEDLIFISYMRVINSHVYADSWHPSLKIGGKVQLQRWVSLLKRSCSYSYLNSCIDSVHLLYDFDDYAILSDYSKTIYPTILELSKELLECLASGSVEV